MFIRSAPLKGGAAPRVVSSGAILNKGTVLRAGQRQLSAGGRDAVASLLRRRNLPVPFRALNQKDPAKTGLPGSVEEAVNLQILRAGAESGFQFERRPGIVEVADTASGTGHRMVSHASGLLLQQKNGTAAGPAGGIQKYINGRLVDVPTSVPAFDALTVGRDDVAMPFNVTGSTPQQNTKDIGIYQTTECLVWIDGVSVGALTLRDIATKEPISSAIFGSGSSSKSKVVQLGGTFYVFWKEGNAIKAKTVLATYPYTVTADVTVYAAGVLLAGTDYDVIAGFDATHIAILYRSAAGTYVRALLSTAFAVTTTVSDSTAANQPTVALCWNDVDLTGASLRYSTLNTAATTLKIQTIDKATLAITATYTEPAAIVANVTNMTGGGSTLNTSVFALIESTAVYGGATHHIVTIYGDGFASALDPDGALASRVFSIEGTSYVWTLYNSTQASGTVTAPQSTLFLMKIPRTVVTNNALGAPQFTATKGVAGTYESFALSSVPVDSSGARHIVGEFAVVVDSADGVVYAQYGLSDIFVTAASSLLGSPVSISGVAIFLPHVQVDVAPDNSAARSLGIDIKPETPRLTEGAAASGSISPGTYQYIVRWKELDASGQIYRTAESTPASITTVNANSSVAVDYYAPASHRPFTGSLQVEVSRTPLGGNGSEYFRVTGLYYQGVPTFPAIGTFTDTASDLTLAAGEPFVPFSATGPLPPVSPPAMNVVIEHRNRAVGINAEDPRRIECSNEYSPGNSLTWTGVIVLIAPEPLYALASQDGHLIGFAKDCVYVWSGDLPDARGEGPVLPLPTKIPSGVGTDQPRSVVVTELGTGFYSSKKGFWLIDRSLQPQYIGAPVESTAQGQTVSGATVHPTYTQVRWTTEGGTTFVLDTYLSKIGSGPVWTTFTGQPCVHSIVHAGKWYLLTSDGKLFEEDLTRWQDGSALNGGAFVAGTPYTARLHVSDINFAGVGGYVRVLRGHLLGEWYDSHQVKITLTSDHRGTAGQVFTFDASVNPDPYELEFDPSAYQAKSTAMDLIIEDTIDYQTRGFAWSALMFDVGTKGGLPRTPVGRKMTGD